MEETDKETKRFRRKEEHPRPRPVSLFFLTALSSFPSTHLSMSSVFAHAWSSERHLLPLVFSRLFRFFFASHSTRNELPFVRKSMQPVILPSIHLALRHHPSTFPRGLCPTMSFPFFVLFPDSLCLSLSLPLSLSLG